MHRLAFFAMVLLVGCSGSKSKTDVVSTPPASSPPSPATALLVVGNSITLHGPVASLGWSGNWGMAASAQAKDFAHVTAAALNLPVTVVNVAGAEQAPATNGDSVVQQVIAAMTPQTLVVVELGDNVTAANVTAFGPIYDQIVSAASGGRAMVCTSTYWGNQALDKEMKTSCMAHFGTFIPIGDIFTDPQNPDYQGAPAFTDSAVQRHPHDWSMQQIASRIINVTRSDVQ